jgi:hypothetical protein
LAQKKKAALLAAAAAAKASAKAPGVQRAQGKGKPGTVTVKDLLKPEIAIPANISVMCIGRRALKTYQKNGVAGAVFNGEVADATGMQHLHVYAR